jgi:LmbE family N-acetylglucosaminyl deacetylase
MQVRTALAQMRALPITTFRDAFGTDRILIIAPHPDDESLGCGGLIAQACRHANPPVVAILTDGSKSHPNSLRYPPARLRDLREDEAMTAIAQLGLPADHLAFLRHPDGAAPTTGEAFTQAVAQMAELIAHWGCRTVLVSWRHDPHCDHEAASMIAEAACRQTGARLFAYPVWGWTLPPDSVIDTAPITGFRLEVSNHLAAKRAAIAAHRSQYAGLITDDPEGFQMPPDFIARFLGPTETYIDMDLSR